MSSDAMLEPQNELGVHQDIFGNLGTEFNINYIEFFILNIIIYAKTFNKEILHTIKMKRKNSTVKA